MIKIYPGDEYLYHDPRYTMRVVHVDENFIYFYWYRDGVQEDVRINGRRDQIEAAITEGRWKLNNFSRVVRLLKEYYEI